MQAARAALHRTMGPEEAVPATRWAQRVAIQDPIHTVRTLAAVSDREERLATLPQVVAAAMMVLTVTTKTPWRATDPSLMQAVQVGLPAEDQLLVKSQPRLAVARSRKAAALSATRGRRNRRKKRRNRKRRRRRNSR